MDLFSVCYAMSHNRIGTKSINGSCGFSTTLPENNLEK